MGDFDREKTSRKSDGRINKNPYSSRYVYFAGGKSSDYRRTSSKGESSGRNLNPAGRRTADMTTKRSSARATGSSVRNTATGRNGSVQRKGNSTGRSNRAKRMVNTGTGRRRKRTVKKLNLRALLLVAVIAFFSGGGIAFFNGTSPNDFDSSGGLQNVSLASDDAGYTSFIFSGYKEIQEYCGDAVCEVNGNVPFFTEAELSDKCFEKYSELDELGRCGAALASLGKETLPTEERGTIGSVKPSGWHTIKYDGIKDLYLYNRCHLIAFCLSGENANEKNLITGTRYMNVEGMLPYETLTVDYLDKNPDNHVMYRVTPVFRDNNLVAEGVLMEAYSVEDKGSGVSFCIWCYNVQPGIQIDYSDGNSKKVQ